MTIFILWIVVTVSAGHLRHVPMEDTYTSRSECEEAGTNLLTVLKNEFPDDAAIRSYCTEQNPEANEEEHDVTRIATFRRRG